MPDRLDWEKARKREIVSKRGADRAPVTRFRAGVAASDADVQRLEQLGYSGKRPETASEVKDLIKWWAPTELGVTRREIDEVRSASGHAQKSAATALAEKLARGYNARIAEIATSTQKMKPSTKTRLRREATRAYDVLVRELRGLAGQTQVSRRVPASERALPLRHSSSRIGPTTQELAILLALPASARQARAEIVWGRVTRAYESKCDAARKSGSTRSKQMRLRALFLDYESAKRQIFGGDDLKVPDG
jgi:hypothetical protein